MRCRASAGCSMTTRRATSAGKFRLPTQPGRQLLSWNDALIACSDLQSDRHEGPSHPTPRDTAAVFTPIIERQRGRFSEDLDVAGRGFPMLMLPPAVDGVLREM